MEREKKIEKVIIKKIVVGPLETNCYLVADGKTKEALGRSPTGEAIIIDPGDEAEKIFDAIKENGLKPKFILLTHNHPDHIGAFEEIKDGLDIEVLDVKDGDEIKFGNLKIKVIASPGHSQESVYFVVNNIIFSGDTLFKQGIGRTDLEGGDFNQIQKSLKRLMQFPDNFKVFPGHGPETTIGEERKSNPFLTF